jgi:hypothetical protein
MAKVEDQVQDHEKRIRTLEVNSAVLTDHVQSIRRWAGWGITILGGSFLLQLANLVLKQ